jgi:dTDP-4-amino-4,6-dideoxygalactose transaminase
VSPRRSPSSATAGAIHNVGARPVFVDITPDTFNIDPQAVSAALTPRTKAVIAVDLFGQMAPIEAIREAAGAAGHRGRGPEHRRAPPDRR